MRILPLLAAAVAAGTLAAGLSGCGATGGGARSTPAASADAAALAGPTWVVHGGGAADGAHVRFDDRSATVTDAGRATDLAWTAQGDRLLATRTTTALNGPVPTDWLTAAVRVTRDGDGWRLLAADGGTTAALTPLADASPAPRPTALGPVVPGRGVVDAPATALEGRWILAGHPRTAIVFADGAWRSAASCETGTPGGSGGYRVLDGGHLLVTRAVSLRLGCPVLGSAPRVRAPAITGIARAATFRVADGTLTLFDRSGTVIGSLVRPGSTPTPSPSGATLAPSHRATGNPPTR
jgi:hypothetical protein